MSVYRPQASPFYQYDFQMRGRRFHGSTKSKSRREAEAVEKGERERAKELLSIAPGSVEALTLDVAAGRYWAEVGTYHADKAGTWRTLERLIGYFGQDKLLVEITDNEVAKLVAWRRGHLVKGRELVAPATVNRTTQALQKLFTRAKQIWRVRFEQEPRWRVHRLKEPDERVRELMKDEGSRLDDAMRPDYEPFFCFARASGARLRECMLRWSDVDWASSQITKRGKGGRLLVIPLTPSLRAILWPLRGHHDVWVFTYVAVRTRNGRVRGQRYPLTFNGIKTQWRRLRTRACLADFRFHDFRHDVGTKLLRQTGNLKLVQKALNHADIKTTSRYAHVLTEEVAEAMEALQKSRNKPRSSGTKAS